VAHQLPQNVLTVLGFVAWGDIGPLTFYKNKRGALVAFQKTWPTGPASPDQLVMRDKFRAAAIAWQALTNNQREQWELATTRTSLCMHGYDLFVHHQLVHDDRAIEAIERQSNTALLPP